MKCAHCGNELNGAMVCSKCGRKAAAPKRGIEVEYKEFEVSEFLEIKKSQQADRAETADESGAEQKGATFSLQPPADINERPPERGTKRLFLLLLLILIFAGLVAGAYYFLRFFL